VSSLIILCTNYVFDTDKQARMSANKHERRPNEHDPIAGTSTTERAQTNGGKGGRAHTRSTGVRVTPAGAAATTAAAAWQQQQRQHQQRWSTTEQAQTNRGQGGRAHTQSTGVRATPTGAAATTAAAAWQRRRQLRQREQAHT
jgi:hypothetical protein